MSYIVASFTFSLIIGLIFMFIIFKQNENDDDNTGGISF